ncbi:MAG: hypothetical protein ACLP7O_01090 [Terracidiphilus sp.]
MKFRLWMVFALVVATGFGERAVAQSTPHDPTWPCDETEIDQQEFPAAIVSMGHPERAPYFCATNKSVPVDIPPAFPNHQPLRFVVIGINPLRQSCQLTFADTPTAEPFASSVAKDIGIPTSAPETVSKPAGNSKSLTQALTAAKTAQGAAQTNLSNLLAVKSPAGGGRLLTLAADKAKLDAAKALADAKAYSDCIDDFKSQDAKVADLLKAASAFSSVVAHQVAKASEKVNAYNTLVDKASKAKPSDWSGILDEAGKLEMISPVSPKLVLGKDPKSDLQSQNSEEGDLTPGAIAILLANNGKDFESVATAIASAANEAQKALQPGAVCKDDPEVKNAFSADNDSLTKIYSDVKGEPARETSWKDQLASISSMATALTSAVGDMQTKLSATEATNIVQTVVDNNQSSDTATLKCTDQDNPLIKINLTGQSSTGTQNKGTAKTPAAGSSPQKADSSKQQTAATETYTYKLQFGYGQRVYESAGMVFSPLQQHSFETAAVGSGPSCPAASGTTTYTGCIVDDSASNWRILPMVIASYRLGEEKSKTARDMTPYISFGATVKSSSTTGTSLEYLLGPSWALVHRYLFLTVGGYAGQVTRLGGGLVLGDQTVTLPSTLPTTTGYEWGFGFAVTFKVGSQQGSSQASSTKSTTPTKSSTKGGAGQ